MKTTTQWWNKEVIGDQAAANKSFVVVEAKLYDPSTWKKKVLERLVILASEASRELLEEVHDGLLVVYDTEDSSKIAYADVSFFVDKKQAERIEKLLSQKKFDKDGKELTFSNAYRFISLEEQISSSGEKVYYATSRLALGEWKERKARDGKKRVHQLSLIAATTALQGLFLTYLKPPNLWRFPSSLRAGICQEVAQQVTSYLGQLNSSRVKGVVSFPTVEIRDPEVRAQEYAQAINELVADLRPLNRVPRREVDSKISDDDPKGDRLVIQDERWFQILRSRKPRFFSLHFVNSNAVKIVQGDYSFNAGVSKRKRHAGDLEPNERVRQSRPTKVRQKGVTWLKSWYATLPILDTCDEEIEGILENRNPVGAGRQLNQTLRSMPIMGNVKEVTRRKNEMLVPLSGDHKRLMKIFNRNDLRIAWSRLIQKGDEWFLQITLQLNLPFQAMIKGVLGISFSLDASAVWTVLDLQGNQVAAGAFVPNEQILTFLQQKQSLEWDQAKQRWVGGKKFARKLQSIAHDVVNQLIQLALRHQTVLAVEDISYIQKSGQDSERNIKFTAWNYGQLRRYLEYKAPIAGIAKPFFISDYITSFTCPKCGAIRKKGETAENATTWRKNGLLHCQKCGFSGELSYDLRSLTVAKQGLLSWQQRQKRLIKE